MSKIHPTIDPQGFVEYCGLHRPVSQSHVPRVSVGHAGLHAGSIAPSRRTADPRRRDLYEVSGAPPPPIVGFSHPQRLV